MVIWDIAQQMQIRTMRKSAALGDLDSHRRDQRLEERSDQLDERIDQVLIITEALYRICKDKIGITDDDLRAAVQDIVAERENKASAGPLKCARCGAAVMRDQFRCQYCGTESGNMPELFS